MIIPKRNYQDAYKRKAIPMKRLRYENGDLDAVDLRILRILVDDAD